MIQRRLGLMRLRNCLGLSDVKSRGFTALIHINETRQLGEYWSDFYIGEPPRWPLDDKKTHCRVIGNDGPVLTSWYIRVIHIMRLCMKYTSRPTENCDRTWPKVLVEVLFLVRHSRYLLEWESRAIWLSANDRLWYMSSRPVVTNTTHATGLSALMSSSERRYHYESLEFVSRCV